MVEERLLEEFLKTALKTGRCILGTRTVLSSIKGSKIVLYSSSMDDDSRQALLEACTSNSVPSVLFAGNSEKLGRLCGKPFKVSAVGVKSPGDANLDTVLSTQPAA